MYKFKPLLKTLVWGTESWVLSGVPGNESIVAEGPQAGKKISELFPGQFPLLVKFIDAHKDLSIQVHPDDKLAAQRHNCKGKTEMWYIIDAEPGAHLLSGLKSPITPDQYVDLVAQDKITDVLADYQVSPGDVFYLPAGRIHAIGGGCFLAEIQETSDITYRIYDYNRPGLDGKPRQLHTDLAKDAIDYSVLDDYRTHYTANPEGETPLVSCRHFNTSLYKLTKPCSKSLEGCGEFFIVMCLEGSVTLSTGSSPCSCCCKPSAAESISLKKAEAALVRTSEGPVTFTPAEGGRVSLLTSYIATQ